jgi:hypothetical protein
MESISVNTVIHSDWSTSPAKRWMAIATRADEGWDVAAPKLIGDTRFFVDLLFTTPGPLLAGFDFPIGVPVAYGHMTGLTDFANALDVFGKDAWSQFYDVADTPGQISVKRPFYPRGSRAGSKRADLVEGLGVDGFAALYRRCEHPTEVRRAASCLFWTLGGNQVGKAAITGWQEVVVPARRRGAQLWPFDGTLAKLVADGRPVIAETYPAEAYSRVGIILHPTMSKRRQEDRRSATATLPEWGRRHSVRFSAELSALMASGFGARDSGEDPFDAVAGALGMIEVADGRRPEVAIENLDVDAWEGWILGMND